MNEQVENYRNGGAGQFSRFSGDKSRRMAEELLEEEIAANGFPNEQKSVMSSSNSCTVFII